MSKAKKTIMVAISQSFTVKGLVYFEALATDSRDAVRQAKAYAKKNAKSMQKDLIEDRETVADLDGFEDGKISIFSVGPASQYHSEADCRLCAKSAKVKKQSK